MKLKNILARELKAWPEGVRTIFQGPQGWLRDEANYPLEEQFELSSDWRTAKVTRAEWQAAVEALKAEQAAELKWPDGAEFMGTTKEGDPKVFYRNVGGDYEYRYEHEAYWNKAMGKPRHRPLIPRPTERAVEWDGDSMIGKDFEVTKGTASWYESDKQFIGKKCTVRATFTTKHNVNIASVEFSDGACLSIRADLLKGVCTQEQIEAEERMAAAYAMCAIAPSLSNVDAVALYDAFYRKQVAE